jgi:hypothetical protein
MLALGKSSKEIVVLNKLLKMKLYNKKKLLFPLNFNNDSTNCSQIRCVSLEKSLQELGVNSKFQKKNYYRKEIHDLKDAYTETGAIGEMPLWYRFGFLKVLACVVVSVLLGSVISKSFTTFLEENDIFKPEDEDDEDD